LSEKKLQEARLNAETPDDIFVHLDDSLLCKIEEELFNNVMKTFNAIIDDLLSQSKDSFGNIKKCSLVLDKDNNSEENFNKLKNERKRDY